MSFLKKDFNKEFHKVQKAMLPHAEELATHNGVKLDYTDKSMKALDEMFVKIAKEFDEAGIHGGDIESNESAQGIAEAVGCYIAECIEKYHGKGRWIQESDGYGFQLQTGGVVYPMIWVMKKLLDPSDYSLEKTYKQWIK